MKDFSEKLAAKLYLEYTETGEKKYDTFEAFLFDKCYCDDEVYFHIVDEEKEESIGEQIVVFIHFCEQVFSKKLI